MKQTVVKVGAKQFVFCEVVDSAKFLAARKRYARREDPSALRHYAEPDKETRFKTRCYISTQIIKPEDGVFLVISNPDPPNSIVSAALVRARGFEWAAQALLEDWDQAKKAAYGHWFV